MELPSGYSVENGVRFGWSSLGDLHPERVRLLEEYICGEEILDAGCGGGGFVEHFAAKGLHVTGLDYHSMFLDVARARPGARGIYIEGDINSLPFPAKSFDCSYCLDVLEHIDDVKALSELIRVTRNRIILAVPAADEGIIRGGLTFHHYRDLTHLRTYTEASLTGLLRSAGLQSFRIAPELPIDLQLLATNYLRQVQTSNPFKGFARGTYHALLRRMLRYARYQTIYSGLTAVIDMQPL